MDCLFLSSYTNYLVPFLKIKDAQGTQDGQIKKCVWGGVVREIKPTCIEGLDQSNCNKNEHIHILVLKLPTIVQVRYLGNLNKNTAVHPKNGLPCNLPLFIIEQKGSHSLILRMLTATYLSLDRPQNKQNQVMENLFLKQNAPFS